MNQHPPSKKPSVVIWYKIYCALMAIGYALFSIYIAFLLWLPKDQLASQGKNARRIVLLLEHLWGGLLGGTIALSVLFIVALFLPRRHWVWVYGAIAICIGIPNCCCLPLTIPLLVFWFRPETKNYFVAAKS
jgi:hypothetical protein